LRSHFNSWSVQNEHPFLKDLELKETSIRATLKDIADGKYATWSEEPSQEERLAKLIVEYDATQTPPQLPLIPIERKRIAGIERLEKEILRSKEEKEADLKKNQTLL